MAYRYGDRYQANLFPKSIEDYVKPDDPVRAYDAFVDSLDFKELGISIDEHQLGNPEYDPKAMLKLLVYGYSYGIRSSRKLERATYHNISFIWITGGLTPDHKTIARFRTDNKGALKNVLKQCAKLCIALDLIEGNTLFIDGTKIRANASINNSWNKEKGERYLKNIDERIEAILKECATVDEKERDSGSLVNLKEELKDKETLKAKIQNILKTLQEEDKKSMNSTDPDCVNVVGRQGTHAGYNGQIAVDEKNGLIVNSDVVNKNNDYNQFSSQVDQANQVLDKPCTTAVADAGYADIDDIHKAVTRGITVLVPTKEHEKNREMGQFYKENFRYDTHSECYRCPEGQTLLFTGKINNHNVYTISDKRLCLSCKHFGVCTKSPSGRRIVRLVLQDLKDTLKKQLKSTEGQAIFKLRKERVEHPFGHIKRNLGVSAFLLKGLAGVNAEMSLFGTCFNMARMITLLGVPGLIAQLQD